MLLVLRKGFSNFLCDTSVADVVWTNRNKGSEVSAHTDWD